jgi:hypothetical protein
VMIARRIFGKKANISCADFLNQEDKWVRDFKGVKMFDIIVGNPPYNEIAAGRSGSKHLDELFILMSFHHLKLKGLLLFITKTNFRGVTSAAHDTIANKNIIYSKVFDFSANPFQENVLTNIIFIQNASNKNNTIFEFNNERQQGGVDGLKNMYFLPLPFKDKLVKDLLKYGSLQSISRSTKEQTKKYLLIAHSKYEIIVSRTVPSGDKYYIVPDPSDRLVAFFKKEFKVMRELGRFNGFSTSKSIFYDIPYYR